MEKTVENEITVEKFSIDDVKFDNAGLVPAIIQDSSTGKVLMLAYMSRESLEISIAEGRTCFWSRSRKELWRKGLTSGNIQIIESITADCDGDSLLLKVSQTGPACHTGKKSCFHNSMVGADRQMDLESLYSVIQGRKTERKEGSYTNYLFDKGLDKILKKVGEESAEVIIASKNDDKSELVYEISDLCYHVLVLMVQKSVSIADIGKELWKRHAVDKKAAKKLP